MVGLGKTREAVSSAAARVTAAAENTKTAIITVGGIAIVALVVGLIALVLVAKGRRPA